MILRRLTIALLLALTGCDEAPQAPIASPGPARAALILKRLDEETIPALPGTRFLATRPGESEKDPILPRFSGERHRNGAYGRNQLGATVAFDLTGVDVLRLLKNATEIAPGQLTATPAEMDQLRRWEDVIAASKAGRDEPLSMVATGISLHVADVYSGLGLGLLRLSARASATECGETYALADPEGANVILLSTSILPPQAKAVVSISYVAHFNGAPPAAFQPSPAWGTRKK